MSKSTFGYVPYQSVRSSDAGSVKCLITYSLPSNNGHKDGDARMHARSTGKEETRGKRKTNLLLPSLDRAGWLVRSFGKAISSQFIITLKRSMRCVCFTACSSFAQDLASKKQPMLCTALVSPLSIFKTGCHNQISLSVPAFRFAWSGWVKTEAKKENMLHGAGPSVRTHTQTYKRTRTQTYQAKIIIMRRGYM